MIHGGVSDTSISKQVRNRSGGMVSVPRRRVKNESRHPRAIAFFKVGWDQLASSAGPPSRNVEKSWWVGEAPLLPPYRFRRLNKAMAPSGLTLALADAAG